MESLMEILNLRPFDPQQDKPISLPGNMSATEYSATSFDPQSNSWIVHPQIWFNRETGAPSYLAGERGLEAALTLEMMGNPSFPRFASEEEANMFASGRSQGGGGGVGSMNYEGMK